MICLEGDQLHAFRHYRSTIIFELVGLVADIASGERQKSHLVSFVNGRFSCPGVIPRILTAISVAISERSPQEQNQWYLFNDFLVGKINQDEALTATPWKTPVILTYQVQHARHNIDDSWRDSIDIRCLYLNGSLKLVQWTIRHYYC